MKYKIEELKAIYKENYLKTGECPDEILWIGQIENENWYIKINILVLES